MENKFILILALLFFFIGTFQINPIIIGFGITAILFLIYDNIFNTEKNKKIAIFPTRKIKLAVVLGNIDLILGILLLLEVAYRIIPNFIIFAFALLLLIKAIPFIAGKDIASIIDIICVFIIILFLPVELPSILTIVISIYLIQKGILSLFN